MKIGVVDSRPSAAVGRTARLELNFELRHGRTILAHAYAEPPLRVGHCFDIDGAAYVILVCASPGVFGGDRFEQRVTVGAGARVLLASQSALQVHPAEGSAPATVDALFRVAEDGELHCLWDPIIPFADARLVQRLDLQLSAESRLYWSDALMAGRASRGEAWRFACLDHELRLAVDGRLQYLERYAHKPADVRFSGSTVRDQASHRWRAGAGQYFGTMLVHHPGVTPELAQQLHATLAGTDDLAAAVDLVEARLMVGRLLAAGGPAFARARTMFRESVLDSLYSRPGSARLIARR